MKHCNKCGQDKNLSDFPKDNSRKDGHRHECKNCHNTYLRKHYKKNKEKRNKSSKKWKIKNKRHIKAYRKKYNRTHKEANRIQHNKYIQKRLQFDLNYRLSSYLRSRIHDALKKSYKVGSAISDLGCTIEEFRDYIATKFTEGMSWENYGKWHLDHIIPLISFDLTDRNAFLIACHYTNYQPLWAKDNLKKRSKDLKQAKILQAPVT